MRSFSETASDAKVNYKALVLAAAVALVVGAAEWVRVPGVTPWEVLGEFARLLLIAYVITRILARSRVTDWKGVFALGGWAWLGFQAAILLGAVLHEHMPWKTYATHAGFVLADDLVIVAVLGAWRLGSVSGASVQSQASDARINFKAVAIAGVAAFVVGALWYSPLLFGEAYAKVSPIAAATGARPPPAEVLGELVRSATVAYVLARFVLVLGIADWKGTLLLGAWVWLGFHTTLLLYSVIHHHMPLKLYAIHAGHGLANELVIAAILGAWRPKASPTTSQQVPSGN
jgi:hypothetical protein